jgi:hypothetical protein
MSITRLGVMAVILAMATIAIADKLVPDLPLLWLIMAIIPITVFYAIQWPHERAKGQVVSLEWFFHVVGGLAILVWLTCVLGTEITYRSIPTWMSDQVRSEFGIPNATFNPLTTGGWGIDGREATVGENNSTWFAIITQRGSATKRIYGMPLGKTVTNIIAPVVKSVETIGIAAIYVLIIVCGSGLGIAGYLAMRKKVTGKRTA